MKHIKDIKIFILVIRKENSKDPPQEKRAVTLTAETLHILELFTSSLDGMRVVKKIIITIKTEEAFENESVVDLRKFWF